MKKIILMLIMSLLGVSVHAQLKGDHLLGQVGLQSATQGPPGLNLLVLPVYDYNTGEIKGDNGNVLAQNFSLNSSCERL
jgi:hypothetical protein